MADYMLERYYRRKQQAIQQLGGICVRCGSKDKLEFDHIDPEEKNFTIGSILNGVAEDRLQVELLKCQLLCYDCHKEKHKTNPVCGTAWSYHKGCRCSDCKQANTYTQRVYRREKRKECELCGTSIDPRSTRCRSCSKTTYIPV